MDQATEFLTARELAKRLRVSTETVRTWSRRGAIPTLRLSRKVVRYNPAAVFAALSVEATKGVARG